MTLCLRLFPHVVLNTTNKEKNVPQVILHTVNKEKKAAVHHKKNWSMTSHVYAKLSQVKSWMPKSNLLVDECRTSLATSHQASKRWSVGCRRWYLRCCMGGSDIPKIILESRRWENCFIVLDTCYGHLLRGSPDVWKIRKHVVIITYVT